MRFVKDYMNDAVLRHELNELTQETFEFDFESWYMNGFYEGDYIPYSYEEDGKCIANVSANRMVFLQNGQEKNYIQIGTVMTRKEYRNRGYAAKLMNKVLADYVGKCDGLYLFANLSALGFYDKMGFARGAQYRYMLKSEMNSRLQQEAEGRAEADCFHIVDASDQIWKDNYKNAVRSSVCNSALEQKNKYSLQMFYTSSMEDVYYSTSLKCYAVMSKQEHTLYLHSVICRDKIRLEQVLRHIREEYENIILGFTPFAEDAELFVPQLYDGGDDYRLFLYGEDLKSLASEKLYFPDLSHA